MFTSLAKFRTPNLSHLPNFGLVPNPRLQSAVPCLSAFVSRIMSGVLKQAVLLEAHNSRSFYYTPQIGDTIKTRYASKGWEEGVGFFG